MERSVSSRWVTAVLAIALLIVAAFLWASMEARASASSHTEVVYVATGENFPDALGGGPAASIVKGPILLVRQNSIPGETAAELTRLSPDKIVIIGGTAAVSASVETGLGAYAAKVERVAGANRYDTAAELSKATFPATVDADTLDGDSRDDLAVLVSSTSDENVGPSGEALTADIVAPVSGILVINGGFWVDDGGVQDPSCGLLVNGTTVPGSFRVVTVPDDAHAICATNGSYAVTAGSHTVSMFLNNLASGSGNRASLDVIFVPGSHTTTRLN